ncbi:MAG: tripartite tricarboxylate transporter substrate binding protein [Proteobacteria bacterium]|nr:tripartite tricarboxylate transporter substrate binding protein [Pseudomonadota bacterium]
MKLLAAALAALIAFGTPQSASAQGTFPSKPVRIIVPFAPGGASDILARALGQKLNERWGQPVVVENRTGANGNIGADVVAKARADGYTLLVTDVGGLAISPSLYALSFDPLRDLAPVTMIAYAAHLVSVHPSLPVKTAAELIALAKARPGKLNFAHSGNGSAPHLAGVLLRQRAGVEWAEIPYRGGAQSMADTVTGQADFVINSILATMPFVQNGQLRAVGISSRTRSPLLPDVPTLHESGFAGFETGTYQAVLTTGGTPPETIVALHAGFVAVIALPEIQARLQSLGADAVGNSPSELGAWLGNAIQAWAKVVKDAGVKAD